MLFQFYLRGIWCVVFRHRLHLLSQSERDWLSMTNILSFALIAFFRFGASLCLNAWQMPLRNSFPWWSRGELLAHHPLAPRALRGTSSGSVEKVGVRALAAPVSDIRNQLIS